MKGPPSWHRHAQTPNSQHKGDLLPLRNRQTGCRVREMPLDGTKTAAGVFAEVVFKEKGSREVYARISC